jgi:hypothetical protein
MSAKDQITQAIVLMPDEIGEAVAALRAYSRRKDELQALGGNDAELAELARGALDACYRMLRHAVDSKDRYGFITLGAYAMYVVDPEPSPNDPKGESDAERTD